MKLNISGTAGFLLSLFLFSSCATAPRIAPRFDKPSVAPIQQSATRIQSSVTGAIAVAKEIEKECPQAAAQINALNVHLFDANNELQTLGGAVLQLNTQLDQQTKKGNKLADDYDHQAVALIGKDEAIARRNHLLLVLVLMLVIETAWVFRKPLLFALTKLPFAFGI